MKLFLSVLAGMVLIVMVYTIRQFGAVSTGAMSARTIAPSAAPRVQARAPLSPRPQETLGACELVVRHEREAALAFGLHRYASTYDASQAGIRAAQFCESEDVKTIAGGYLFSLKAESEHALGRGDWRSDFDVAEQLLLTCTAQPETFGNTIASKCRTQQADNAKQRATFEMRRKS